MNEQIKLLLNQIEDQFKGGSVALITYAAQRRQVIAEAFATANPYAKLIAVQELMNIKAFANTEAVKRGDTLDAGILQKFLDYAIAFDTLLLAALT